MASSALAGKLVTLIGGSGFLGSRVAQNLLAKGARLRVASRDPKKSWHLKPLANLGQLQFASVDVRKPETVRAVVAGADAVVNLVGAFDGDLDAVQGSGAGKVAELAKEAGASAFVHVSAIGADSESELAYQSSKGRGEVAVAEAFPGATILRPSILFGEDDQFVNMFANLISSIPAMPVFAPEAKLQPVHVDDVADAVIAVLEDASLAGKTYELAGPDVVTMLDLNERIAKAQDRSRMFLPLPDFVGRTIASLTGWLPGAPITADQYAMLEQGNVARGDKPGLAKLGITPKPLDLFLDRWMVRYQKHGRFHESNA
ncbi:complex I NDUFA9 subunit family protein [Croceicoccus naphthovorans]|uniref:3-beta hydroxysteroid dehydrogenase n=1 Tax=Croceicoccus naphthovorans TaxID=1348774 RepID=A0A0G3XFE7_9SPHN|nr:complex I NDUFA9 subunit family protein [Croceicoccus naphthovorans]AKM09068.1 3-beta hydroxysteroid dehydrogenase [Croceicoccus naphthovorans]MBB3992170.1 NADH dehydrogenase [Croceicoccus naphthovorans]